MAVVLESVSSGNASNTTSTLTTLPTGIVSGDLLFLCLSQNARTNEPGINQGWTILDRSTDSTLASDSIYYKVATGSETAPTLTFNVGSYIGWSIYRISGSELAGISYAYNFESVLTSTFTYPSVTITDPSLTLRFITVDAASSITAQPTGTVEAEEQSSGTVYHGVVSTSSTAPNTGTDTADTGTNKRGFARTITFEPVAASGPTLTGPASTTEGSATVAAGTDLDTVTTFNLISGTFSIAQTIDSATATTLNYVAESGANDCVPATPVSGVPLEATISAAGVTPYQIQQEAE